MGGLPPRGDESRLVATSVERFALLVHALALADELVDRGPVAGLLGLRQGGLQVLGALVERALLEIDRESLDLIREIGLRQIAWVRIPSRQHGLRQRRGLGIETLDEGCQAERRVDALVVRLAGEHDGSEELAGEGARQLVRADDV